MRKLTDYRLGQVVSNLCGVTFVIIKISYDSERIVLYCEVNDKVLFIPYFVLELGGLDYGFWEAEKENT